MAPRVKKIKCLWCGIPISGNENKRFCSAGHKNAYHNARRKKETGQTGKIITILKNNRRTLEALLEGKEVKSVKEQTLLDNGFVFRYHTHNRINQGDQKAYIFCFEYGNIAKKTVVHHRKGDYLRIMIFTPLRF